jgi:hypothetical protein
MQQALTEDDTDRCKKFSECALHLDKKNPGLKATMLFSDEAT